MCLCQTRLHALVLVFLCGLVSLTNPMDHGRISEWSSSVCYASYVHAGITEEDGTGAEAGQQGNHSPQKEVSCLSSAIACVYLLCTNSSTYMYVQLCIYLDIFEMNPIVSLSLGCQSLRMLLLLRQ